jgi:hypothetical protein
MAEKDEAERFFEQAKEEVKRGTGADKTGLMALPEAYRRMLMQYVEGHFANSRVFKAFTETVFPAAGKYEDKTFPHNLSSLIKYLPVADLPSRELWPGFNWQRLSDLFPDFTLLSTVTPSDIVPGNLGNSYFLSALSALAERPERVRRLFTTKSKKENCQYRVMIMDLGQWKEFVIDDYVPCDGELLAFSSSNSEEEDCDVWVSLLEKVWAKKYGSYYDIQTGYADEALTDLTGAPCRAFPLSHPDLWTQMLSAYRKGHILTADSVGGAADSPAVLLGLEVEHCYAVISVVELQVRDRQMQRLVQIRNPWKRLEWTGDWSDSSPLWTPKLKSAAHYTEEEGAFWMSWEDFQQFFGTVRICMTEDSYWTTSLPMDQTKEEEFSVVEVVVSKPTDLYFITSQVDDRRFGGLEGGYSYSPVRFLAGQLSTPSSLRYITGSLCPASRDAYIHLPGLAIGTYLIYVEFQWKSELTDLFGVSVYSGEQVVLRDVTANWTDYIEKCANRDALHPTTALETELILYQTVTLSSKADSSPPNVYIDWYQSKSESPLQVTIKHLPWENMTTCPVAVAPKGQVSIDLQPGEVRTIVKKQKRMEAGHGFKVFVKRERK